MDQPKNKENNLSFNILSDKLVNTLNERIGSVKCPMCQHGEFSIVNGFFLPAIQEKVGEIIFGKNTVPMVGIVCKHCGYISFHSVGSLGFLTPIKHDNNEEAK